MAAQQTKTGHTPGPWQVDPRGIGTPWNIGTDLQDVALANQLVGDDMKQSERTANARLIAAAPAMRAMLERLANWTEKLSHRPAGMILSAKMDVDEARAILARIDGEEG